MRIMRTGGDAAVLNGPDTLALTAADKRDIEASRPFARALGYGRLSIHAVDMSDGSGADEIVSAHRADEKWSTWAFARAGDRIVAWSALTGDDVGAFPDMLQAVRSVLLGDAASHAPPDAN